LAIASQTSFRYVAALPAILLVVFGAIWLRDRLKGGYQPSESRISVLDARCFCPESRGFAGLGKSATIFKWGLRSRKLLERGALSDARPGGWISWAEVQLSRGAWLSNPLSRKASGQPYGCDTTGR